MGNPFFAVAKRFTAENGVVGMKLKQHIREFS
jgi:hypothetical protein